MAARAISQRQKRTSKSANTCALVLVRSFQLQPDPYPVPTIFTAVPAPLATISRDVEQLRAPTSNRRRKATPALATRARACTRRAPRREGGVFGGDGQVVATFKPEMRPLPLLGKLPASIGALRARERESGPRLPIREKDRLGRWSASARAGEKNMSPDG